MYDLRYKYINSTLYDIRDTMSVGDISIEVHLLFDVLCLSTYYHGLVLLI